MSFRDVEDLFAERGIIVSYETIRHWCRKFGSAYVRKLKQRQNRLGDIWHLDELFLRINGQHYGVLSIRTAMSSTFWFSRAVINDQRNDSFEDYCAAKGNNRFESLRTN